MAASSDVVRVVSALRAGGAHTLGEIADRAELGEGSARRVLVELRERTPPWVVEKVDEGLGERVWFLTPDAL